MSGSLGWPCEENVVVAYAEAVRRPRSLAAATAWCHRFGSNPDEWARAALDGRLACVDAKERRFLGWLLVTGRLAAPGRFVVDCGLRLGQHAAQHHPELRDRFAATAASIDYGPRADGPQWTALAQIGACVGSAPDRLTRPQLVAGRAAMTEALSAAGRPTRLWRAAAHGAEAVLFHAGVLDGIGRRSSATGVQEHAGWAEIAPGVAGTMRRYLDQVGLSLRPSSVVPIEIALRELGRFLASEAPDVACVADLRRHHIEAYKAWSATRSSRQGQRSRTTVAKYLGLVRAFLERITDWDYEDVPAQPLIFSGDFPIRDRPLPRFLDDPSSAKLLRAARADPDPFVRLCVEFLARTGLRKSEFLGLTVDAVVQIGSAWWLRVPVGNSTGTATSPSTPS